MAGVQALENRSRNQLAAIERLQVENAELRKRLDAIEKGAGTKLAGIPLVAILVLCGTGLAGLVLRRRLAGKA